MGALIMTKGTKRLAAHYNDEFDTWISFYRTPAVLSKFQRSGNIDVWRDIIQTITDTANGHTQRPDHLTLLPPDHVKHVNLIGRWKFFLKSVLSQANQNKLADALHKALTDPNVYIVFDVVVGKTQNVTHTSDVDDGDPIARVTIVTTGPMLKISLTRNGDDPPPIDDGG
jgi:hypothetical protein